MVTTTAATVAPVAPRPMLSSFVSDKFRFWSLMAMVLLVFVHGYNLDMRYLRAWSVPNEPMAVEPFIEYLFANGLLRFRIPMLFAISGYLFALRDHVPHATRVRERARTLLLPYLLWSTLWVAVLLAFEQFETTRAWLAASGIAQLDEAGQRVLVSQHTGGELTFRWLVLPFAYQLWFIRVLFFYNLAYPLLARALSTRVGTWLLFGVALMMWLGNVETFIAEGEGLLFFSLGVWLQKRGVNIESAPRALHPAPWAVVFVGAALAKTTLAFTGMPLLGESVYPLLAMLHKLIEFSGLIAMWFGCDALVRAAMRQRWFVWLSGFSFVIYAAHAPLVALVIDPALALTAGWPLPHLLTFVWLPLALVAGAVLLGVVLRATVPGVYGLLTGGRGLRTPTRLPAGATVGI